MSTIKLCLCCVLLAECVLTTASATRLTATNAEEIQHLIRETVEHMIAESEFQEKIERIFINENGLEFGTNTYKDVVISLKNRIDFLENKVNDLESKQNIQREMNVKHAQEAPLDYIKDEDIVPVNHAASIQRAYENNRPAMSISETSNRRRRASIAPIAFSAYLSHSNFHMSKGECVKFDQVLLNQGNGYNKTTGTFKAPLTGVYLFTFHFDTTSKLSFVQH